MSLTKCEEQASVPDPPSSPGRPSLPTKHQQCVLPRGGPFPNRAAEEHRDLTVCDTCGPLQLPESTLPRLQ
ncbi:hypothetical protein J6590_092436, partial [Homalodisca vitripennis]